MFIHSKIKLKLACGLVALTMILAVSSCTQETPKSVNYASIPELVTLGDAGVFRGFNLGDSLNTVLRKETKKPIEVDSGYLYYEYAILDTVGSFNITYNFDEDGGLNEIQSNIFIMKSSETEIVLNQFKTYFDKYFGPSRTEMGYDVWSVKSAKYGEVKINLNDESSDFTIDGSIQMIPIPKKNQQ
jgi:hypothetical protein